MTEDQTQENKSASDAALREHDLNHIDTLEVLKETDKVLEHALVVLSVAREKLQRATEKYEERLHGPTDTSRD